MARLEYISYTFFTASQTKINKFAWEKEHKKPLEQLPQIFWKNGSGWPEVNIWALERIVNEQVSIETVKRAMRHLLHYANFLECNRLDWRHFPIRREDQTLRKFRKYLIDSRQRGELQSSTVTNCMAVIIQFYRFADSKNFIGSHNLLWVDKLTVIPFYDSAGFKRAMARLSSDLNIPNKSRIGVVLENGLLPLSVEHMTKLLLYTAEHTVEELHLMLSIGFFTGSRIGSIVTLTVASLNTAREDPLSPGIFLLPVGPGTGIATKFSVRGEIMVPKQLLMDLKRYSC